MFDDEICLCLAGLCPVKNNCYRFKTNPSGLQSYFLEPPFTDEGCEYYLPKREIDESNKRLPLVKGRRQEKTDG